MKKKSLIIILIIVVLCICTVVAIFSFKDSNKENVGNGKTIGISNESSDKLQIKILNEYINIRKEPSVNSEILGIVKEGSLFDVIDYKVGERYFWVHIKTNNNIEGYVATFLDDKYYEFVNGDIDYIAPTLNIAVDKISVDSYSEITEEYIKSIITYSDDKDNNPSFSYETVDENPNYYMHFKVTDKAGNITEKKLRLAVKNERLASNGKWITYEKVRELRNKFISIAKKYGNADTYSTITNSYWRIDFGNITSMMVFTDMSWVYGCYYSINGDEIKATSCNDQAGEISYEAMKKRIASQEKSAKNAYLKIKENFEKTGYKIKDLFITFD